MTVDWPLMQNVIRRNSQSNTFGMVRRYPDGRPKPHQGWDFQARIGTDTFAIADGVVVFVKNNHGDYGTQLCLEFKYNGMSLYAFYAHLNNVFVWSGQTIKLGQIIASTGDSGNAHGMPSADEHLHFEIRFKASCGMGLAERVSPIEVFGLCPLYAVQEKRVKMCLAT